MSTESLVIRQIPSGRQDRMIFRVIGSTPEEVTSLQTALFVEKKAQVHGKVVGVSRNPTAVPIGDDGEPNDELFFNPSEVRGFAADYEFNVL